MDRLLIKSQTIIWQFKATNNFMLSWFSIAHPLPLLKLSYPP